MAQSTAGIAGQKNLHHKYFNSMDTIYKKVYKLLMSITLSSSIALSDILQQKLVKWLIDHGEWQAAKWIGDYWSGDHYNYTKAQFGIGGTNTSNSVEGRWGGIKPFVAGTS